MLDNKAHWIIAGAAWLASVGSVNAAYQTRCNGSNISNPTITSVLAEARPAGSFFETPTRFHGGTDVADCHTGDTVQAIYSGTVTATTACTDGNCTRVWDSPTHAFDYVHVNNTPSIGSYVIAGSSTVGTIVGGADGNHLHLNEILRMGASPFRVNPQRPGAMTFSDTQTPLFISTNIGSVQGQSIFLAEDLGVSGEGLYVPILFRFRNNTWYVKGRVDALVATRDEPAVTVSGITRKGVYEVNAAARTSGSYDAPPKIAMNNLQDNGGSNLDAATIFYQRNTNSDTYFGTNLKINDNPAILTANSYWDTGVELPGFTQFCVTVKDIKGNSTAPTCVNAAVDNSAPSISMSNAGGTVTDGGATSTGTITIAPTDAGGIYSITVAGVSYSSTNYPSGVQSSPSNTFPDSSVLANGSYTATVVDLAGNSTSNGFNIA